MANESQIRPKGGGTGVPRWRWPLIGAVLFALVIALVYVVAALWG